MRTLFHDPTSEPSRAVHWLCVLAGIPIHIDHVWLTRGEHRSPRLLAVNPRHQVPALDDDGFHLSETTAIMSYLTEMAGCHQRWFGDTPRARACIQMLLSWYHTNLRLKVTLQYFLPLLLMPAYHGGARAAPEVVERARGDFAETLEQLHQMLRPGPFLAGESPTAPDLLFACELFALDVDPDRASYFDPHSRVVHWLERMRTVDGYEEVHAPWNAVVPRITERLQQTLAEGLEPSWVADACEKIVTDG